MDKETHFNKCRLIVPTIKGNYEIDHSDGFLTVFFRGIEIYSSHKDAKNILEDLGLSLKLEEKL